MGSSESRGEVEKTVLGGGGAGAKQGGAKQSHFENTRDLMFLKYDIGHRRSRV